MYSRRGWYEVRRDGVRARCMAYWNGRRFNKFRVFHTHDKPLSKMALFNAFAIAGDVTAFRGLKFPAKIAVTSTPVFGTANFPAPVGPTIAELVASKHLADRVPE